MTAMEDLVVQQGLLFQIVIGFEPGFPCLSPSFMFTLFDVPLFGVVSRTPRP